MWTIAAGAPVARRLTVGIAPALRQSSVGSLSAGKRTYTENRTGEARNSQDSKYQYWFPGIYTEAGASYALAILLYFSSSDMLQPRRST
ncbi:hypothetical protein GY45DRAFT_663446 [Cubamyces sp. BRFM 1775]|nr:hypothetical protein GY45DRAFT_663446 [Cubamyces sp. BRFM 1775]